MKVNAVLSLKATHSLSDLLSAAKLPRSTFFYHQSRRAKPDPRAELKAAVRESFTRNRGRYGHRRIHAELGKAGLRVSKKTVLRVMRDEQLSCLTRRRKRYVSFRGEVGKVALNVLARDFAASGPNQKWSTDVTEFRVGDNKLYLSAVMDLYGRQVVGYRVGRSASIEMVTASLQDALQTLTLGERPIVHSDQGFQYQHLAWRRELTKVGATQSMSRRGNCLDNAVIENFFGHLKSELFHHANYLDIASLQEEIHEYIHWYNHERISLSLGGMSPAAYRVRAQKRVFSNAEA